MRVAVVSDIHSDLHALEAVLEAIEADAPDELWCLGDIVGYGPRPNECCAIVEQRAAVCLAGNHDLAIRGTIHLDEFHGDAALAARNNREALTPESHAFLDRLEPQGKRTASRSTTQARAIPSGGTAQRRGGARDVRDLRLAPRARRPQPCRAPDQLGRGRDKRRPRAGGNGRPLEGSRRFSIRVPSASRATATRGPPISSSTSQRDAPTSGVSSTTWRARRPR